MDEFSYLIEKDHGFASVFQRIVDEVLKDSKVMLILCGSSISMMEEGVLSGRSPLYGRKTGHLKVGMIPFTSMFEIFPDKLVEELVRFYSVFGGIPYHLSFCNGDISVMDNIKSIILSKNGNLFEEVDFLLKQELRETDIYRNILFKISSGATKVSVIADKTHFSSNTLSKYLQKLMTLQFIRKEYSITDSGRNRPLYRINDNFMDFWFMFCEPYRSNLEIGESGPVLENIEKNFNNFVGRKFEDLVRKELFRNIPLLYPFEDRALLA